MIEKGQFLDQLRIKLNGYKQLTELCWENIKELVEMKKIEKSHFFSKEGSYNRDFAFTCSGIARIYFLGNEGVENTKYFIREYEFIIASLEPNAPSRVNIQALTDVYYLSIPYLKLEELLQKHTDLSLILNNLLLNYFGKKQQREINLISKNAANNYLIFLNDYPKLEERIPHYYIASYLGITPTQLSRIRKKVVHQHL